MQLANAAGVDVCPGGNQQLRKMFNLGPTEYPLMKHVAEFVDRTSPLALVQCSARTGKKKLIPGSTANAATTRAPGCPPSAVYHYQTEATPSSSYQLCPNNMI